MGFFSKKSSTKPSSDGLASRAGTEDTSLEKATSETEKTTEMGTQVNPTPYTTTPRYGSSRGSIAPSSSDSAFIEEIKHEAMCHYIFQQACHRLWIDNGSGDTEGVMVRKWRGNYQTFPPNLSGSVFAMAISSMNVMSAMTVSSRAIKAFLSWNTGATDMPLSNGQRVQIIPDMSDLPRARKHQCAAFVASLGLLAVWDDEPMHLLDRAREIENDLIDIVWTTTTKGTGMGTTGDDGGSEKMRERGAEVVVVGVAEVDEESGALLPQERPTHLQNSVLVACTLVIVVTLLGLGFRSVVSELMVDKQYIRAALLLLTPIQIFFTLFFAQVIVGCIAQCIGPIQQMNSNSRFYSAIKSPRLTLQPLPHVTIQCPVYKEGLEAVIMPTVRSIKQAMTTYELQGGSANMLINDDGMQLIDEQERQARIEFYADNGIGWTARPKHDPKGTGFLRRGKFKKASNMNFGLMISCAVEEKLTTVTRNDDWTQTDEAQAYATALNEVLEEKPHAWADGNIRMGDYILLIDSDTRVPADCLLDAVSEMEASPDVGILQFASGVMNVTGSFFENGITFFTDMVYTAIRYTVSNGDVAPFVGHNAVLRWSAIQQVSYEDEDGYEKFWSESHVSEDFDMSLRLQCNGFIIRLASWANGGFKEGVSLTVYDELARWEKYAYGCNELLFHPIRTWLWRGPFTPLFRRFLASNIRFTSKITIISYIGTYYAIGAAWIMTTVNYFAIGWFNGYLDKYYIDSWRVWFSIVIVFNGLGNVALAMLRYRANEKAFLASLLENAKWILMLAIFLGGLSLHVSQALLCHMFEIDIQWGATSKELEFSNFFLEVPKVLRRFKFSFAFSVFGIIGMIVLAKASFIPYSWNITDFTAILPMATVCASHLLLPIALNPALMTFSW